MKLLQSALAVFVLGFVLYAAPSNAAETDAKKPAAAAKALKFTEADITKMCTLRGAGDAAKTTACIEKNKSRIGTNIPPGFNKRMANNAERKPGKERGKNAAQRTGNKKKGAE